MVQMKDLIHHIGRVVFLDFISHMVQMKAFCVSFSVLSITAFISHMVQMKAAIRCRIASGQETLYPTWFR